MAGSREIGTGSRQNLRMKPEGRNINVRHYQRCKSTARFFSRSPIGEDLQGITDHLDAVKQDLLNWDINVHYHIRLDGLVDPGPGTPGKLN